MTVGMEIIVVIYRKLSQSSRRYYGDCSYENLITQSFKVESHTVFAFK